MSHEITVRATGRAEMAYAGETPWHGLGQKLEAGRSIEEWKAAAGMDWRVCRSRVRYGEGPQQRVFEDKHVLFRSDTKDPLAVVSDSYKVVQPGEVLEFFRDLTTSAGFALETAGTLFGGRKFWALARIGECAVIAGHDKIDGYLLLATSCDGTMKNTAKLVTTRVVCNNTLTMARDETGRGTVKTGHRSVFDPNAVKDQLGIARNTWGDFLTTARGLAKISMNNETASEFVGRLLKDEKVVAREDVTASPQYQKIMDLFKGQAMGGTLLSAEGTAWGVLNAVTEFVDHHARGTSASHRLDSALFGRGDALKSTAFSQLAALI
jgi:phage/plasmid-like protein (TIGR03299 family)